MNLRRYSLLLASVLAALPVAARDVDKFEEVEREVAVAADVIGSALRETFGPRLRVGPVAADFLARQGVLMTVELGPGSRMRNGNGGVQISTEIDSLAEIPLMVREIIEQLDIAIAPYAADELENLRELREEQRDLRDERREIHGRLRIQRRTAAQADSSQRERIDREIAALEDALRVVDEAEATIDADIDEQYARFRASRAPRDEALVNAEEIQLGIARAACDFGPTLKSLGSEEYLTFKVRRASATLYHAFKMDFVRSCQRGDIDAARLLERAYTYPDRSDKGR
jgi:hypothetical protein